MSSQNDMQTPKNWRFALRKTFLWMRRSRFVQDVRSKDAEICAVGLLLALFGFLWIFVSMSKSFIFLWGAVAGIITFIAAMDRIEDRDQRKIVYGEASSSSPVHDFSGEVKDLSCERFLEQVLEEMAGEAGVAEARSTYESFLKAAQDPYNDTGWDEPWSEALMAVFNHAVEVVQERERGE